LTRSSAKRRPEIPCFSSRCEASFNGMSWAGICSRFQLYPRGILIAEQQRVLRSAESRRFVSVSGLHVSSVERPSWVPVPRQQFVELGHGVAGDHSFEHVFEIGEGLDVVELRGSEKGGNKSPPIATAI
jgi:hypothetical protein